MCIRDRFRGRAQLGAGLVSWREPGSAIDVENLATGRRWRWSLPGFSSSEYPVVHTASALFAAKPGLESSRPILTANLRGLHAYDYSGPAPATVAPPAGIATQGP